MNCTQCQTPLSIHPDETAFLKKMDFVYGNQVFSIPEPDKCPDCRAQARTAFRNEQNMYQGKSALSGTQLITLYDPETSWGKHYKIYSPEEWHSDKWDGMDYGRDFDFSRPFFEQFFEMNTQVPKVSLVTVGNENSPFTTGTGYCKNCHLINSSEYCEDCYYGKLLQNCKSSVDCSYLYNSELCYECFSVYDSYNCAYLYYSQNCSDCWFSENLSGCRNCFLCTNLKNKEYYFMNEPLSKEEYKKRVEDFKGSHQNFQKAKEILEGLREKRAHKYANLLGSENCTGDFLQNSQNCQDCYDVNDSQDCRYVRVGVEMKDVYDSSNMYIKPELNYQMMGTIETYHVAFSLYLFHSQNVLYSDQIYHSKNIFGCTGLKRREYCILNKQYSKEEYEQIVPKIIEHMKKTDEWGQFFPVKYSPFGYNESLSSEYFPLSEQEVKERGWNWHKDDASAVYQGVAPQIPDHIQEVPENITEAILKCEASDKLYKIMPQELKFYRQMGLPIPHRSPQQRHKDRMSLRPPRQLWNRECDACGAKVQSPYSLERPERIYCEGCYLKEVY